MRRWQGKRQRGLRITASLGESLLHQRQLSRRHDFDVSTSSHSLTPSPHSPCTTQATQCCLHSVKAAAMDGGEEVAAADSSNQVRTAHQSSP